MTIRDITTNEEWELVELWPPIAEIEPEKRYEISLNGAELIGIFET